MLRTNVDMLSETDGGEKEQFVAHGFSLSCPA